MKQCEVKPLKLRENEIGNFKLNWMTAAQISLTRNRLHLTEMQM